MLTVLLSSMTAAAMLVMLLSLSPLPLPLRSPCRCGRAHRNAARRTPVPPPCSPSRHAAVAVPAAAMLTVLLSSMTAAAMLVMLLSLSPLPLPLRSPCRCGRAHRNAARRSPVQPPCSPSRHAAVAVPAAAMPAVLLSPIRPPPCSSCCARCPRYRYACRDAVTGLIGMLPDVCIRRRRHACCSSVAYADTMLAAAMLAVQQSLLRVPLCLPSSFLVSFDASLIWSSSAS
ncbi:hypothetical protein PF003_g3446 [Phytophthora fragariae]|nr:hypothetical protein PF003_g3446 [Phytophthora fragariae]